MDEQPAKAVDSNSGWLTVLVAAGAFVMGALLLLPLVYGYFQASHDQLAPNGSFGFRDAATRSSLPAWYASQRAGFSWLLFAGGPILVLSMLFYVVAAVRRRSPRSVFVVAAVSLVLFVVATVVAGVHADHVARAITG